VKAEGPAGALAVSKTSTLSARIWVSLVLSALLGALLAGTVVCGTLECGRRRVSRLYGRALKLKPRTRAAVEELFADSQTRTGFMEDAGALRLVRYRFFYGEDIDVFYDDEWRVLYIHPTFAASWGRPWPFIHRVRNFAVVEVQASTETLSSRIGQGDFVE
jgi:hypothetical protein